MNETIAQKKEKLLNWLIALDDAYAIIKVDDFRKEMESQKVVSEPQAEFKVDDTFDEKLDKSLTIEESRKRTKEFIEKLPWKN